MDLLVNVLCFVMGFALCLFTVARACLKRTESLIAEGEHLENAAAEQAERIAKLVKWAASRGYYTLDGEA